MLAGSADSPQQLNGEFTFSQLQLLKAAIEEKKHAVTDTLPAPAPPPPAAAVNKKGYVITIADNNGECVVLVKDQQRKIIKAVTLEEWDKNKKENEARYGAIPPSPPPPPPVPVAPKLPAGVTQINIHSDKNSKTGATTNKATVVLKNGTVEEYSLDNAKEKAEYVKKYGELRQPIPPPPAPIAPPEHVAPVTPVTPVAPPEKAGIGEYNSCSAT